MRWWLAFPLAWILGWICTAALGQFAIVVALGVAIWAAIDSRRLDVERYDSILGVGPVVMFLGVAMFGMLLAPAYLVFRGNIKSGRAKLRLD